MNILMFCPQFRPVVGGAERQAEKQAQALVKQGCQVTILTPRIDPNSPAVEFVAGVRIERFPLLDLARRWPIPGIALLNIPAILWQVNRAVRQRLDGQDVLHCHLASLPVAGAAWASRHRNMPVMCKAAIADRRSDLGEIEKTGFSGHFVVWLLRRLIPYWIATTEAVAEALQRAGISGERIRRIPNGVEWPDPARAEQRTGPARRFLYLGRLSTNINRDTATLIRAFDRLAADIPAVELALVGAGDLFEDTAALAARCRHAARIQMPGLQPPEPWLEWADCFVLPSRQEGLSNALLEAMAHDLACIANDIPPNREVLADGAAGVLVPVGDEDALYESLRRLATDADHCGRMQRAASDRVRAQYDIDAVAAQYLDLYAQLAAKPRATAAAVARGRS